MAEKKTDKFGDTDLSFIEITKKTGEDEPERRAPKRPRKQEVEE